MGKKAAKAKKQHHKVQQKFSGFKGHADTVDQLQQVISEFGGDAKWMPYAIALASVENVADTGKSNKKVKRRHKKTVKQLRKLARHAHGKSAVVEPKKQKRKKEETEVNDEPAFVDDRTNVVPIIATELETGAPNALEKPRAEGADDLKMIAGIGPKLEQVLNGLGVFHFDQIAAWSPRDVMWVDDHLRFSGRITREDWIAQADALASGGRDEYVRRFGKEPR
ncbi:MAG: hypothetical protein AAGI92_04005 [Pseudomonadota bacterium]